MADKLWQDDLDDITEEPDQGLVDEELRHMVSEGQTLNCYDTAWWALFFVAVLLARGLASRLYGGVLGGTERYQNRLGPRTTPESEDSSHQA